METDETGKRNNHPFAAPGEYNCYNLAGAQQNVQLCISA